MVLFDLLRLSAEQPNEIAKIAIKGSA